MRTILIAAALLALFGSGHARADFAVGMCDADAETFTHRGFEDLNIVRARVLVPFDIAERPETDRRRQEFEAWLRTARDHCIQPFVSFSRSDVGRYALPGGEMRAPTIREFRSAFRAFRRAYPRIRLLSVWNEPNFEKAHVRTPNGNRWFHEASCPSPSRVASCGPKAAAMYWRIARHECPRCTIVAGEFTSTPNDPYWARYQRFLRRHRPKVWAIHPYEDMNRFYEGNSSAGITLSFLDALTGTWAQASNRTRSHVWLTAVGAFYRGPEGQDYGETRQRNAVEFLINDMSRINSRVTRIYYYNYQNRCVGSMCPAQDRGLYSPNESFIRYDTPDRRRAAFGVIANRPWARRARSCGEARAASIAGTDGELTDGELDELVEEEAAYEDELLSEEGPDPLAGIDPMAPDSDGDGLEDDLDEDADGDGIYGEEEIEAGTEEDTSPDTDGDGTPDLLDEDDDGDGVPTVEETDLDADGDGIGDHRDDDSFGAAHDRLAAENLDGGCHIAAAPRRASSWAAAAAPLGLAALLGRTFLRARRRSCSPNRR